jgi:Eukaryotic aspartyl protease
MNLSDATTLHDYIPGSSYYGNGVFLIPCSTNVPIEFIFGGVRYPVSSLDIVNTASKVSGFCVSNIIGGINGSTWIMGSTFLRNVNLPH